VIVLAAGQSIADRYKLDRRIAVGGMGEVWEASDSRLGRSVAVKVLRPELSDDHEFLHRFRIEARTVASLDHPGIAGVHDYGEDEGPDGRPTAYLVMELVRGEPLSTIIARGPIDTDETLRLLEEAGWALQAAHERGFVHRDVKPGNILVRTDGVVKLTDFGIAKAADAVPVTRSGMVMGTAHYIAPEQASGSEAGPSGDVYSLGIVGYECLAGQRPFRAESAVAVAMMQVREAPPPLPASVPPHARQLIEAVLVKDPKQRYANGGEFALAVAAVRRGEPLPPPGAVTTISKAITHAPSRRRPSNSVATPPREPRVEEPVSPPPAPPPVPSHPVPPQHAPPQSVPSHPVPPQHAPPQSVPSRPVPHTPPPRVQAPPLGEATTVHRRPMPPDDAPTTYRRATPYTGETPRRPPPRPSTEGLRLQPKKSSRTLFLVLFVMLTLAAIAVGVYLFRFGSISEPPNVLPRGAPAGTVAGREDVLAGPAVTWGLTPPASSGAVR
jgi:eukaryotic-like serine/threonine-protein kinase